MGYYEKFYRNTRYTTTKSISNKLPSQYENIMNSIKYSINIYIDHDVNSAVFDHIWPLVAHPMTVAFYHSIRFSVGTRTINSLKDTITTALKQKYDE